MTRDIRNRLAKALERGEVKSAGSALGPGMRRRLERALTGSGHEGGTPLPRIYSAGKMEEGGDRFPGQLDGKEIETPEGNVLRYRWSVPLKELAMCTRIKAALSAPSLSSLSTNGYIRSPWEPKCIKDSAAICARDVITPCPISILPVKTDTRPSSPILHCAGG